MPLTTMSGEEFVKKLSENEKDFAKIRLKPGTVLDETALRAIGMLQQMAVIDRPSLEPTPDDPFILSGSELKNISARNLYMPYAKAEEAVFDYSDLEHCYFRQANFRDTSFRECKLYQSSFIGSRLEWVNFERADLRLSDFSGRNIRLGTELAREVFQTCASRLEAARDERIFLLLVWSSSTANLGIWRGLVQRLPTEAEEQRCWFTASVNACLEVPKRRSGHGLLILRQIPYADIVRLASRRCQAVVRTTARHSLAAIPLPSVTTDAYKEVATPADHESSGVPVRRTSAANRCRPSGFKKVNIAQAGSGRCCWWPMKRFRRLKAPELMRLLVYQGAQYVNGVLVFEESEGESLPESIYTPQDMSSITFERFVGFFDPRVTDRRPAKDQWWSKDRPRSLLIQRADPPRSSPWSPWL